MILIGYDGSDHAKAAIERCGAIFAGQPAIVLNVWEPFSAVLARIPTPIAPPAGVADTDEIDAASQQDAERAAEEGAERARDAGIDAAPSNRAQAGSVAQAILAEARAVDASAIVLGTRGRSGIRSLLLGSVSHSVVQHADRAVMVVPSPEIAKRRAGQLRSRLHHSE
jgi:nucleotide-binding universal stress UspA family protein